MTMHASTAARAIGTGLLAMGFACSGSDSAVQTDDAGGDASAVDVAQLDGAAVDAPALRDGSSDGTADGTTDGTTDVPPAVDGAGDAVTTIGACGGPLFIDAIASWTEVTVDGGGMDAIRSAISASDTKKPTRVTVKAGTYRGQCLYVEDHLRTATAPLWIRGEGTVQIDCTDGNGQAVDFHHSSYIAFDNFTIGPASGYYGDSAVHIDGAPVMEHDPAHYGEYLPSHHIIVRKLVARNLNRGPDGDGNPDSYESGCCDAVKSNQAEYVWVLGSTVSRTARHGFDNVGVHHAYFCDNVLTDMVGAGFGMEAKGGSEDVVFERNLLRRVRRRAIILGGEGTDDVFIWPTGATYEGKNEIARNNVIIDAAEAGIGFHGCQDCTAIGNSVWITKGGGTGGSRDMLRLSSSTIEGAGEFWGGSRRVGTLLRNGNNGVIDNLFGTASPDMGCALEANTNGVDGLVMNHNLWWNGAGGLPTCGSAKTSITAYPDAASSFGIKDPTVTVAGTPSTSPDLRPQPGSPLIGAGVADAALGSTDYAKRTRPTPPSIGALEP